ncbi:MAG: NAD-dependent epimerase/dehydratase family protein [Chloroflexota bacterium]|nr:NAD-dependent epimerase/dehydratase family protein [Chloroflexota bacterium]
MRVFLTGATGFVMGAVARALRARGDAVVALVRAPSRAASLTAIGCDLVAGDVVDPTDAVGALRRCDALIHGAAIYEIGVSAERRRQMEDTNVNGTRRMLEAAKAAATPRIVYVSTIAAFGNTHREVVAEGHRPTSPPTSAYEDTKRQAHEIALEAARGGAPIVIVQPGQVYGPNDHSAVGANFRMLAEGRLRYRAFEDLGLNLVHVDDLADGILRALDRGRPGECYILGGEIARLGDAYRAVAKAAGRSLPVFVLPPAIARIAGRLIPSMKEVVSSADGVTFWATDAKARGELGTTPRDLMTGMRDTFGTLAG